MSDGPEPTPGRCPACHARYLGGEASPADAVAQVAEILSIPSEQVEELTTELFAIEAGSAADMAITSDRRDGFYAWWVFLTDGAEERWRRRGDVS